MLGSTKIFIAPRFDASEDVRIIRSFNAVRSEASESTTLLYKKLPRDYRFSGFTFTDDIDDSDFVLVPQRLKRSTPKWQAYLNEQVAMANAHGKRLMLFIGTDLSHDTHVDHSILVFKGSEYRHGIRCNEVIVPPFCEDLGEDVLFEPRRKSANPTIAFCGYAGFPDLKTRAKYQLKNLTLDIASTLTMRPYIAARKRGIFFRRKAIKFLSADSRIEPRFIVRDSFSANSLTGRIDPSVARREYVDNMIDSDFVLAPRGDGNCSVRFYEALSLGRIPLLIDTDMVLPLESVIDYSKFILRVDHTDLKRIADIVVDFYESLSDSEFKNMQVAAREAFLQYLRYDSFFNFSLPILKSKDVDTFR